MGRDGSEGCQVDHDGNRKKDGIYMENVVSDWFYNKYYQAVDDKDCISTIKIYTEMKLGNMEGDIIRGHPKFDNKERWNDYVLIKYEMRPGLEETFPARVITFFSCPGTNNQTATHVLVQEIRNQTVQEQKRESQLFKHFTLDYSINNQQLRPKFKEFPISCIDNRVYCIELNPSKVLDVDNEESLKIVQVKSMKEEWTKEFMDSHKKHHIFR